MAWRKKHRKEVPIVPLSEEEVEKLEEETIELVKTQLPLGRVKKVIRMNPDVEMVNNEALQLMAKATELFIKELATTSNQYATAEKRKTLQLKDIEKAIKKNWSFAFLEDALDGWPKHEPKKRNKAAGSQEAESTILEEGNENFDENSADNAEKSTNAEDSEENPDDVIEEEEEEEEELPETVPEDVEEKEKAMEELGENRRDVFAEQF